jgi:dTDP-4-amino-4,6-dideoxygalactose transaminase
VEPIQLFLPKFRTEECLDEIRECLDKGWSGLGYKTLDIEREWVRYTGLPHAHFVNSGSGALHAAMQMLKDERGWADGDEVISTPLTFVVTNHSILYANLTPVFADVDDSLCLDPVSEPERIGPRTRAVIFVGMGGTTGQLEAVAQLCREHSLALILDAAHMAGTRLHGSSPGLLADVTCFSFQAVKNLPTGDAGMVCFADAELDARARRFTWFGIDKDTYARWNDGVYSWRYDVDMVGYKYNGNSIMAALALVGLRYLDQDNARRRQIGDMYRHRLAGLDHIQTIDIPAGCESSQHLFQIRCEARDALMGHLQQRGIFAGVHYRVNTEYEPYRDQAGTCPEAERVSRELLSLPLHLHLSDEDVHRVCDAVIEFTEVKPPPLP